MSEGNQTGTAYGPGQTAAYRTMTFEERSSAINGVMRRLDRLRGAIDQGGDFFDPFLAARAKEEIAPTRPVPGVEHAYWCRLGAKEFVRWARGEDEDEFFNAFARIYAARESDLEEGARFVGAFRANGLAIPVWELVPGTEAEELTKPLQAMGKRLEAALADTSPLSPEVRRAKAGIISRQVNL